MKKYISIAVLLIGLIALGQSTANAPTIDSILPSQGSSSGKFLTTNGSASSWGTPTFSGPALTVGTAAARPDAGTSGSVDFCVGCLTWFVDNGTAWQPLVWGMIPGKAPPAAALFVTTINAGSTTLVDVPSAGFGLHMSFPTGSAAGTAQFRGYGRTVKYSDAGPSLTIHAEAAFSQTQPMNNGFPGSGVFLSDGTKILTCGFNSGGANQALTGQADWYPQNLSWTNSTTVAAHSEGALPTVSGTFFRIRGLAANSFECDVSYDRSNWYAVGTQSPTFTPVTAGVGSYMQTSTDNGIETSFYDYSDGTWPDGG